MKIFHKEEGKEVVYVNLKDITYLYDKIEIKMPNSIFRKVTPQVIVKKEKNQFLFVRFDKKEEVEFFKKYDFIVDYANYKNLTIEEIIKKWAKTLELAENLTKIWNEIPLKKRKKNGCILKEIEDLEYKADWIKEIYLLKKEESNFKIPYLVK